MHRLAMHVPDGLRHIAGGMVLQQFQIAQKHRDVRLGANLNLYEVNQVREQMEDYFRLLTKRHAQVKGQVLLTLEMLKEFLSLAEQSRTSVQIKV